MTLTKDVLVYIKIPFLIVLVGAFYWRDFLWFWQTVLFSVWLILTLIICLLVFVFLFQRRNALKTLFSISENHNGQGAGFVLLALVLYVAGSYTPFALWLHLCSLILFIAGYLTLLIDFRIPRMLFLPLVALLFVVPPISMEVFVVQNLQALVILYLSVDAVIMILVAYIVKKRALRNETKDKSCLLCQSDMFSEEAFCFHCGRQRLPPKHKPFRFAFTKFLILFLIVLLLSFMYVPTLSLDNREAFLMSYTAYGVEEQTIIPYPEGWKLESSKRLVDYEKENLEDLVVEATYIWGDSVENKSHIQLEIGSGTLYMMNKWQLPGWQRTRQDIPIPLTESVRGRFVVLTKGNNSITVLYWTAKSMFKVDSDFSIKNVGVSVFSNFTEPLTATKVSEVLGEFSRVSLAILNWWDLFSRWTLNFYTLSEIYLIFRDVFFTVLGIGGVLVFAGWARSKDKKVDELAENAFFLMEDEATLLVSVSKMKPRSFLGKELFDTYQQIAKSEVDLEGFYKKLEKFLMHGLIAKDYVLKNGNLVMVWKRMFL